MSQPSLLHPQSTPSPQNQSPSSKSGKQAISKSLKHAFSRRKRSIASFRSGRDGSDFDLSSQPSGDIGPESLLNNEPPVERLSDEVVQDTFELSPQRGRSPSRRIIGEPPAVYPPRRDSDSLPHPDSPLIVISSPLPQTSETLPTPNRSPEVPKEPKPHLSLQTSSSIPAMSITPATPINPPSGSSTPDKPTRGGLSHQRSWSKLTNYVSASTTRDEKPLTPSGSMSGGMWGSLVNAANKVTDTISSLTSQNNPPSIQITRSVSAAPPDDDNNSTDSLSRPRSQTMPTSAGMIIPPAGRFVIDDTPKQMAIDTLGEGELSLKELGFESDTPNVPRSSGESMDQLVENEIEDEGQEHVDFSKRPIKRGTVDLAVPIEPKRAESVGRSRRSLTVPVRGTEVPNEIDRRAPVNGVNKKPRRLSSLGKKGNARRNESVASRASSDAVAADDVNRRPRKRSSLATADTTIESPKLRAVGTADVSEDRGNEDGLYIHGKDGRKRKVPITGFAVQSGKRNRDFHGLFKSVEESDYLIEDYSCALSKEILVQGRMYVSEHYICFNSNIFGWVTNLVIAFTEVVSIEKRSTAVLFPNGIQITTLHAKYVFASFVGRDGTYDLLTSIWRLSHPDSRSPDADDSESLSPSSGSFSDDEESSEEHEHVSLNSNISGGGSDDEGVAAKAATSTPSSEKKGEEAEASASQGDTGPESHDKTECDCGKDGHYDKVVCDEVVKAPLGKVWNCVYGENKEFLMAFLKDNHRVQDVSIGDWKSGEGAKHERQISYIKPLNNPMGPKQTKCNITEQIQIQDFNSSCVALSTTTTPDVPSGSSFQVMTKFCMMWAGGSTTRVLITCNIEWSKSSWIKGAIEKGVNEGQASFAKDLLSELRKKLEGGAPGSKRKTGEKKKSGKRKREEHKDDERATETKKELAGLLGKVHEIAESVGDVVGPIVKPLISSTCIISVLLFMVFYALIRVERTMSKISAGTLGTPHTESTAQLNFGSADQHVLWDWIDTRIRSVSKEERDGQLIWNTLAGDGLTKQGLEEIEDAIRTTEGKLEALKAVVEKRKEA